MRHGRPFSVVFVLLMGLAAEVVSAEARPAVERAAQLAKQLRNDAELADVCFVDEQHGWAVGDRGAIWHTQDGGRSWNQQASGVTCRLHAVTFTDKNRGWACGGVSQPYTHASRGILLRTRDGGKRWTTTDQQLLPVLVELQFFDAQHGVAIGRSSALFPSGVFSSDDGGRSWQPVPAKRVQSWLTGDFTDPNSGAVAGYLGASSVLRRRVLQPSRTVDDSLRALRKMVLTSATSGWLIGDGGLVLSTGDLGQSWQTPLGALPSQAEELFDFHAVAAMGQHCWVAGTPGSRVFLTEDGGRRWSSHPTGSLMPIYGLSMLSSGQGWAVGAMGTILASDDAGRTWKLQRSGGRRAALLGMYSEPQRVPLELFAKLSGSEGYLGVVEVLTRQDAPYVQPKDLDRPARLHEALVDVGACGAQQAWRFPVPESGLGFSAEQVMRRLDRANDGRARQLLERHMVRQIRMWRPTIVFTHLADHPSDEPLAHLVKQMVTSAVNAAGDPTRFVELATSGGLPPWAVTKVYGTHPSGQLGTIHIHTAQVVPRLGRSLADQASLARGLIEEEFAPPPSVFGFRVLFDSTQQPGGRKNFFSGVPLAVGGEARRMLQPVTNQNIDRLRRIAQKRRNMEELLKRSKSNPAWLGQIDHLTSGLERSSAGEILYQLGQQYFQSGRWEMAAESFQLLWERYPQHPLSAASQMWLLQYYASGEAAIRIGQQTGVHVQAASVAIGGKSGAARRASPLPTTPLPLTPLPSERDAVVPTASSVLLPGPNRNPPSSGADRHDQRWTRASELGKRLERTRPELYAEPSIRFPLAIAHRNLGYHTQAERFYLAIRRTRPEDAWWRCAQGESWIAEPHGAPPKQFWTCKPVASRPHLDGLLDEPIWEAARHVVLRSASESDQDWPAVALLAYDNEFLYIAFHCRKAPGVEYPPSSQPRPRDPDLSRHDRVDLFLDIDRDYATYYHLTVDHRGWTGESCLGDPSWNPTWYVAAFSDDQTWTAEAAVALSELTSVPPEAKTVWAVGAQRVVPGAGFQAWSQPADMKVVPQGFGYLAFE